MLPTWVHSKNQLTLHFIGRGPLNTGMINQNIERLMLIVIQRLYYWKVQYGWSFNLILLSNNENFFSVISPQQCVRLSCCIFSCQTRLHPTSDWRTIKPLNLQCENLQMILILASTSRCLWQIIYIKRKTQVVVELTK